MKTFLIILMIVLLFIFLLNLLSDPEGRKIVKSRALFVNVNLLKVIYVRKYIDKWYIVGVFENGEHYSLTSGYGTVATAVSKLSNFKSQHSNIIAGIDHEGLV